MKPTAMQRPLDKEGCVGKKPAPPPPPPPKACTTINIVCGGMRSPSATVVPGHNGLSGDGTVYSSSVTVREDRESDSSSMSSRERQAGIPIPTSPKPSANSPALSQGSSSSFLDRSHVSGSSMASVTVNGYCHDNQSETRRLTDCDFIASLPSLPSDDELASVYSHVVYYPPSPIYIPNLSNPPPPIAQTSVDVIQSTGAYTKILVNSSATPLPDNSVHLPDKTTNPLDSTPAKPSPPPVSRKPTVSRSTMIMDAISENGCLAEQYSEVEDEGVPAQRFHLNVNSCNGQSLSATDGAALSTFAGRRDVTNPESLREKQIVSSKGTVRGFKNRVRAGIVTFVDTTANNVCDEVNEGAVFNYRVLEKEKIVVYTTSMMVVRETHERCKAARNILQNHMVRFQQRDLYMSLENQRQLQQRLNTELDVPLPQIFMDGLHLGGSSDLERLNESGELRRILQTFPKIQVRTMCDQCGGYRFVPCGVCHGSKKSVHRNNFTEEFCALRCMHCNEHGLQRCQRCVDQQE